MKVSRVVLIVVALHVLVIGGIFVFEGCSRAKAPATTADTGSPEGNEAAVNAPALPSAPSTEATAQNMAPPTATAPSVAPSAPAAVPSPAAVEARTYVVKKGDTLTKIAKSQGVKSGDLMRVNNMTKTTMLKVGQKLQIPASTKTESTEMASASVAPSVADAKGGSPVAAAGAESSGSMYVVKAGDSLWKIAHGQNVSIAALKQANSLTGDSLKVGQKLHIPAASTSAPTTASASTGNGSVMPAGNVSVAGAPASDWHEPGTVTENGQTIHYVDAGESPAIIAKKFGVKVDELMKANNISDAKRIFVGQRLVIPSAQAAPPAAAASAPAPAPAPSTSASPAVAAPIVSMNP